jgi:hypothetical protein
VFSVSDFRLDFMVEHKKLRTRLLEYLEAGGLGWLVKEHLIRKMQELDNELYDVGSYDNVLREYRYLCAKVYARLR